MSIKKKENGKGVRWEVVVDLPLKPGEKRKQRTHICDTYKEAQKYERAWLTDIATGMAVERSTKTLEDVMQSWFTEHKRVKKLQPMTVAGYTNTLKNHIFSDRIAHMDIQKIEFTTVDAFKQRLEEKGVGERSITLCEIHLNATFKWAMKHKLVAKNPMELVDSARVEHQEMLFWTLEEANRFASYAKDNCSYGPIWLLALRTGLRRGELLGLRWEDVDLEGGKLTVRQSVSSINGHITYGGPKTKDSKRTIPLGKDVLVALRAHRAAQNAMALRLGQAWQGRAQGLVFTSETGTTIQATNLYRNFRQLIDGAGVKQIRIHDVRHTYCALSLKAGIPVQVVSKLMGHSNAGFTFAHYSHVMPDQYADATSKLDALFEQAI